MAQYFPIHIMWMMTHSSFTEGPFDEKDGQWPHAPF